MVNLAHAGGTQNFPKAGKVKSATSGWYDSR